MHCFRMLCSKTTLLSATLKYITDYQPVINYGTFPIRRQFRQYSENVHVKDVATNVATAKGLPSPGIFKRFLLRFALYKRKYQLMALGYHLYNDLVERINYSVFFKDFNMPDTFYSWFLITELHVWMLMVRFMAEGAYGKVVRNNIVDAMWTDVMVRVNKLGHIAANVKKKQIIEISEQFNAALIGYDEGIMSDDKILAGALWRRYFCSECNDPEQLEKLLVYVRKQISLLDKIPSEEILTKSKIQWIDLRNTR